MEAPATEEAEEARSRNHHRLLLEFGFALGTILLVALSLSIVGRHAGWPNNDEGTTQVFEAQIYAAHFRQLDFLPVWSGSDAFGLGSPLPIYYHKAFFMLSGTLFLLLGNIKAALVASIAAFMVVGVYGMRTAAAVITDRKVLIVVAAYGFIFTNYAFTDWLVRGDIAEFSAMMMIPWLLWWCLNLVARRSASFALIPIMVLLVYAHNLVGVSAIIPIALALATYLFFNGTSGMRAIFKRMVISTAVVIALLSPVLIAELGFNGNFDPASKAIQGPFAASRNFVQSVDYFWNSGSSWLTDFSNRTPVRPNSLAVQIDFAIWIPIVIALPFLVILVVRRRGSLRARLSSPVAVFLVVSLAVFLFFQFPLSGPIYRVVHPLEVLQFPWRLMAYITALGILAVVAIAETVCSRSDGVSPAVMPTMCIVWLGWADLLIPSVRNISKLRIHSKQGIGCADLSDLRPAGLVVRGRISSTGWQAVVAHDVVGVLGFVLNSPSRRIASCGHEQRWR